MKTLSWKYTQFSQFNMSDTLLLVSGVHFGVPHSTSGEIAVFSVQDEFQLRCRIVNRPYDIFGTWFSDQHLLSGDLRWLAHLISTSVLWLNKANQEVTSEHVPITHELFKFYNTNASSIRAIMISNAPWLDDQEESNTEDCNKPGPSKSPNNAQNSVDERTAGNPLSHVRLGNNNSQAATTTGPADYNFDFQESDVNSSNLGYASPFRYSMEFRREFEDLQHMDDQLSDGEAEQPEEMNDFVEDDEIEDDDDLEDTCSKYLIFTTGSKTYTPHQIGFKKIGKLKLPKRLDPGPSLQERIALRNLLREQEVIMNTLSSAEIAHHQIFFSECFTQSRDKLGRF